MNAHFIQTATLNGAGAPHQVTFTNTSSQQMNPGQLESFHRAQTAGRQEMPFTTDDIPQDRTALSLQLDEGVNMVRTSYVDNGALPELYLHETNQRSGRVFRTPMQRAWAVPAHLLEARATDLF